MSPFRKGQFHKDNIQACLKLFHVMIKYNATKQQFTVTRQVRLMFTRGAHMSAFHLR